jgi:hypothetical protein
MKEFNQTYHYLTNCIHWPREDVNAPGGLCDMKDQAKEITRVCFLKNVNRWELAVLELGLGYEEHHTQGLTMAKDYRVRYFRSKLHGLRVYFFRQSACEHIFINQFKKAGA